MKAMRTRPIGSRTFSALLALLTVVAAPASGEYEIAWYTIDGGGGRSVDRDTGGGEYSITGTIGQADADWGRSETFELLGGFWPGGPLCIVQFDDFARFAALWWLRNEPAPALEADLNYDSEVNFEDLAWLTDYWLGYCPYRWPLR